MKSKLVFLLKICIIPVLFVAIISHPYFEHVNVEDDRPLILDISHDMDAIKELFYIYLKETKKVPKNDNELINYCKTLSSKNECDLMNPFLPMELNKYFSRIKIKLGKPLKLKQLKIPPNNNVQLIKERKKGDDITVLYYIKIDKNYISYSLYAIYGQNRFLSYYDNIIEKSKKINLITSNAK